MAGRIPREFIDELLLRVDIVDLIDTHVPLKKTGNSFKARCPFHTEKSPSFTVNRNKQFYHCFGCGAGGNAISFLMAFSHLDFVEAIEDLAGFAGIDVPREATQYQSSRQDYSALYSILERVAVFYVEQLRQHSQGVKAIEYLKNRGLSGNTAQEFSLGYAPDDWDLLSSQFDPKLLVDAGLLVTKGNGRHYDRFRNRLIFPIRDKRSRIVGFGGRVLDDSLPKYLNSPETAVFSKGKELYGLYELLEKQSKPKRIIIVEGYMDVLALSQLGIPYSVATLGTATSKTQLDLLFRFTSELVFCFDGDAAGQNAAWKAVQESFACLKDGRQVRVMMLPKGQDPDSLIRSEGLAVFEQHIANSQVLSDYFIESLSQDLNLTTIEGRAQLVSQAKPHIEKIPSGVFREMMINRLKELSASPTLDFLGNKSMLNLEKSSEAIQLNRAPGQLQATNSKLSPARIVIALLLQNPQLFEIIEQLESNWLDFDFPGKPVLVEVIEAIEKIKPGNAAILAEYFRGKASEKIINTLVNWDFFILENGVEEEFSGALDRLLEQINEQRLAKLLAKERQAGLNLNEKEQLRNLLIKK